MNKSIHPLHKATYIYMQNLTISGEVENMTEREAENRQTLMRNAHV